MCSCYVMPKGQKKMFMKDFWNPRTEIFCLKVSFEKQLKVSEHECIFRIQAEGSRLVATLQLILAEF